MPNNIPSSGNKVEQIAKDYLLICGVNPSLAPSTRKDEKGEGTNSWGALSTSGLQSIYGARASYQAIDNSSDHIGGNITEVAQNRFVVNAGSGGINFTTNGNISLMAGGGLVEVTPTECFSCLSKNINLVATDSIKFGGGASIIMDECAPQFGGNVIFEKNIAVKGGAFVQGEAYLTHITTQREFHYTEPSDDAGGYINPDKDFLIQAKSLSIFAPACESFAVSNMMPSPGASLITGKITIPGLPELLGLSTPYVPFTINGIDAFDMLIPAIKLELRAAKIGGEGIIPGADGDMGKYDIVMPGHMHKYESPAITYKDDTSEVWEAAQKVLKDEPVQASPSQPNGMSQEEALKKIVQKQTNKAKKFLKNLLKKAVMPLWPF